MACFRLRALWPERSATLFQIALVLVASEDAPFTKAKKRTKLGTIDTAAGANKSLPVTNRAGAEWFAECEVAIISPDPPPCNLATTPT